MLSVRCGRQFIFDIETYIIKCPNSTSNKQKESLQNNI